MYKKFPENPGGKRMELEFLRSSGKLPGTEENLKRKSCFLGRKSPNGNSRSFSLQSSLIPVSGLRRRYSVNGNDFTSAVYHIPKP